ncbi:MAG: NUDIX hydrolase [Chloroflexi bacterium]|nr:NUDIX hydrolase [Chloroflexota bacterium]
MDVVSSEKVFQGRAISLRVDQVRASNGTFQMEVLEHTGGVAVVPIDGDDNVWMVRQYRHAVRRELLEIPAGTVKIGEDPALCAARELQEEIGMKADKIDLVGEFFLAPGYSSELMRLYLATGLTPSSLPQDEDEEIVVEKIPFAQAVQMAIKGELHDAKSVAGLLLADRLRLRDT